MSMDDPYIWLEDLESERTREFISYHNKRFRGFIGDLYKGFVNRIRRYYCIPYIYGFKPCDRGVYVVQRELDGYRVLLVKWDGVVEDIVSSKDLGKHVVITDVYPSLDGSRLGLSYSIAGSDEGFLKIIDVDSGEEADLLEGCVGNVVWVGSDRYYYVRFYRSGRTPDGVDAPAERVFVRDLSGFEEMVFGRSVPTNYLVSIIEPWMLDRLFIMVSYGWSKSIVYGGYRSDPGTWRLLADIGDYIVKPIGYYRDTPYLVFYDRDGFGRVVRVGEGVFEEVIGEQGYPIEHAIIVGDRVYVSYLVDASSRFRVYSVDGEFLDEYLFREPVSIRSIEFYREKLILGVESFSKPLSLYILDRSGLREFYGARVDLGLEVSEEWTVSSDGTRIHMFFVKKQGARENGVALVYGYGGFGISITPFYVSSIAPFLEDGGLLVVANLRGGGEYGEEWHRMGMKENKQNVFEDYKAVLRHVRNKGFKTIGWGASNGGLLIASTMVQEPELFNIALIGYPVIDMIRFNKLYIGRLWTTEYGDPDNPSDREYLLKYSPYHNIREQDYPLTLVYTGLHDDRVHPGHALKFVAKLMDVKAPVYLRVETVSGHLGSTPDIKIREYSDIYAFIYKGLNIRTTN